MSHNCRKRTLSLENWDQPASSAQSHLSSRTSLSIYGYGLHLWLYKRTTKALVSLRIRAGWSGPSLSAYAINPLFSYCGLNTIWFSKNALVYSRLQCTRFRFPFGTNQRKEPLFFYMKSEVNTILCICTVSWVYKLNCVARKAYANKISHDKSAQLHSLIRSLICIDISCSIL